MSDLIRVVDLEIWSRLGVSEEERAQPQRLLVTMEMKVENFSGAAATDEITQTVDYFHVAQHIKMFAKSRPRKLLETFAVDLATDLLAEFAIQTIRLEVKKFIIPNASYVSVEVERP